MTDRFIYFIQFFIFFYFYFGAEMGFHSNDRNFKFLGKYILALFHSLTLFTGSDVWILIDCLIRDVDIIAERFYMDLLAELLLLPVAQTWDCCECVGETPKRRLHPPLFSYLRPSLPLWGGQVSYVMRSLKSQRYRNTFSQSHFCSVMAPQSRLLMRDKKGLSVCCSEVKTIISYIWCSYMWRSLSLWKQVNIERCADVWGYEIHPLTPCSFCTLRHFLSVFLSPPWKPYWRSWALWTADLCLMLTVLLRSTTSFLNFTCSSLFLAWVQPFFQVTTSC